MSTVPALIIVSGPPASGKTTIGRQLARELGLPFFAKDAFKELLADDLQVAGLTWSKALGSASFEILFLIAEAQLEAGKPVVIEGNFSGVQASERLRSILRQTRAHVVQVNVAAEGELLLQRYEERDDEGERHPIHLDRPRSQADAFRSGLLRGELPPLDIDGDVIRVDTSDFEQVDVSSIAVGVRRCLKRQGALVASGKA